MFGANVATVEGLATGTATYIGNATYGNPAAVTTGILSEPGIANASYGKKYTSWTWLANDLTGSIDVFGLSSSSAYHPTVGNSAYVKAKFSPFDGIPELGTITSITSTGAGFGTATTVAGGAYLSSATNTAYLPTTITIPQLLTNSGTDATWGGPAQPTGSAIGEYLFWVNGVTITSGTTTLFGGDTWGQGNGFNAGQDQKSPNMTLTITDSSNNSAILFYWPTSYSVDGGMWGNLIPEQVPVNILGFADVFGTGSAAEVEFVPIDVVATPEPAPLALLAVGGAMALLRRKRKTA